MKTRWNYTELPEGYYCADVGGSDDRWMLRVTPNRGDYCVEGIFKTQEDACTAADDWIAGRKTELTARLYSACF